MPAFDSQSPPGTPSNTNRRRKNWTRKCERCCCLTFTYLPLAFVYGLTTWAVWVDVDIGFRNNEASLLRSLSAVGSILLYLLSNWSYNVAVFVSPGEPISSRGSYSHLPTSEPQSTSFTVKSTGGTRFCKKCQARKPDRAHHCSTCKRCVLKMDHHCPWLATCVGFRNYKPFLLFLVYVTLFCFISFAMSSTWLWKEVFVDAQYTETMMPVNYVMLAVIAGIFSVVLAGFTGWHLSLAWRNQTTIECLEKTRYLSPLRRSMQLHHYRHQHSAEGGSGPSYGQQLREIHTNAIPGVTRPEEGEERRSPDVGGGDGAPPRFGEDSHFHRSYEDMQRSRERERYESYLDERDSDSLPNAFDLGWRRNLLHLFGENPKLWLFPICNTTGDGWNWEANPRWTDAREALRRTRESQTQWHDQRNDREDGEANNSWPGGDEHHAGRHYVDSAWSSTQHHPANGAGQLASSMGHQNQNEHFSRISAGANGSEHWNNQDDGYETSSDDEHAARMLQHNEQNGRGEGQK